MTSQDQEVILVCKPPAATVLVSKTAPLASTASVPFNANFFSFFCLENSNLTRSVYEQTVAGQGIGPGASGLLESRVPSGRLPDGGCGGCGRRIRHASARSGHHRPPAAAAAAVHRPADRSRSHRHAAPAARQRQSRRRWVSRFWNKTTTIKPISIRPRFH